MFKGIPDVLCEQVGLKAAWGFGNDLFVFAGKGKPSGKSVIAHSSFDKIHKASSENKL